MKPCYIIDLDQLAATAKVARTNADKLGVHLLMALKSFPLPAAFPTLAPYVEGFTCSGLYESKLAREGRLATTDDRRPPEVHVHAPAYQDDEIDELCAVCSHIVFNSLSQLKRYGAKVKAKGVSVGLRINPGVSSADCLKYDPCCPDSRFGVMFEELAAADPTLLALVDGLHLHALCEGYADDFARMVETFAEKLGGALGEAACGCVASLGCSGETHCGTLRGLQWINLGGGEVVNDPAFATPRAIAAVEKLKAAVAYRGASSPAAGNSDVISPLIYIEPSEYLVRYSGYLEAHVLDVIHREKDIAVLDISASCHATDLVLFDMKPDVVAPAQATEGKTTILGCVSCLAGDVLGEYTFAKPLEVGDTILFGGLGCYSFAQQSWFNGIRHPDIVVRSKAAGERTVLSWTYADYLREFNRD